MFHTPDVELGCSCCQILRGTWCASVKNILVIFSLISKSSHVTNGIEQCELVTRKNASECKICHGELTPLDEMWPPSEDGYCKVTHAWWQLTPNSTINLKDFSWKINHKVIMTYLKWNCAKRTDPINDLKFALVLRATYIIRHYLSGRLHARWTTNFFPFWTDFEKKMYIC